MTDTTKEKTLSHITPNWSIQDAMDSWLELIVLPSVKPATYGHYHLQCRNHICPRLGRHRINEMNPQLLADYFAYLMEGGRTDATGGLSLKTVSDIRLIINSFFNVLLAENIIESNPCSEIHMPQRKRKQVSILSIPQQQRLERVVGSSRNRNALGILVSLHTGIRIGELCALQKKSIDVEKGLVNVHSTIQRIPANNGTAEKTRIVLGEPKTSHSIRNVPLPATLLAILTPSLEGNPDDPLFSTRTGKYMEPRTYQDLFLRVLKKCEITPVNFHTLRHTFAVRALENGIDPQRLSQLLGHSSPSIIINTYRYYFDFPSQTSVPLCDQTENTP